MYKNVVMSVTKAMRYRDVPKVFGHCDFLLYPFYFDFHSARIIFDVSSGFYLWNINNTKADICKKMIKFTSTKNSEPTY
jgi:hypothetical protein